MLLHKKAQAAFAAITLVACAPAFAAERHAGVRQAPTAGVAEDKTEPSLLGGLKALRAAPRAGATEPPISPVREAALREAAQALGVQAGLGEESRRILALVSQRAADLDRAFRFNELMMGAGVLPPVISESQDAWAIDGPVMRIAQRTYRIDEPARFAVVAPTWRAWLLVGLAPDLRPEAPAAEQLLPQNEREALFWSQVLDQSYAAGATQARAIFELNMARLERTYVGMRRFRELHARGMVTAPEVIASDTVIDREDPNTVVVGATVFRIVRHSDFIEEFQRWKPLGR